MSDPGQHNRDAQLAFDAQGEVILVWQRAQCRQSGGPPETCTSAAIDAAIKPPGQPFGAAQTITGDPGTLPSRPQVAADAQGGAVAVWTSSEAASLKLRYALRPPGGTFGPAQTLADEPNKFVINPRVAVDPAGHMVAVWIGSQDGTNGTARFAMGTTAQGFGPSHDMPGDSTADPGTPGPALAFDGLGKVIAIWSTRENTSQPSKLHVAFGDLQGFAAPQQIADDPGEADTQPQLATDGQGNAVVAFLRQAGVSFADVGYALRSPGQQFGALETIAGNPGSNFGPAVVGMAPGGRAIALWTNQDTGHPAIRFATSEPGQSFGNAQQMQDPGDTAGSPSVGMDAQGNAVAVWTSFDAQNSKLRAAVAPAGQPFGPTQTLEGAGSYAVAPQLALDPQGNAVAAWQGEKVPFSTTDVDVPLELAGYDAAGPLLRNATIPSQGEPGKQVIFSVSPVDVWSGVASTRFTFGDGLSFVPPLGSPAQHTYTSPGTFNASVAATDTLGNSSSAGGPVVIKDTTAPVVSGFGMTRRSFAVKAASAARKRAGSAFRYTLSERAGVTIQIARRAPGRRVGRRCVKPSPRLRKRRSCARFVTVGKLTARNRAAGRNLTAFSGRIHRRALRPGRYRATLIAIDAAGNRSKPRRVTFRIVR